MERGADLFSLMSSDRMHGNGSKVQHERFSLNIEKYFFTEGMVRLCNRLTREVIDSCSA